MVRLSESGHSKQSIADETGYSFDGVKKILRAHRRKGELALRANYSGCGKSPRSHFSESVKADILARKTNAPGADYVHSVLRESSGVERVPSPRVIQRMWAASEGGNPRKKGRKGQPPNTWTKEVHHTWQMDGKELMALSDGATQCSWFNIADEASSTALRTEVSPPEDDERGA
ncbi:MAG TPA: hypothetical protein PK858_06525 [Saprospiraceae bacterium]|nr:hypothetical protein [Saprospiraceae bacterium]